MTTNAMTNEQLDELIRKNADTVHESQLGYWQFDYFGRLLIAITDETHNRMRIITPVATVGEMNEELAMACMAANFDRALDARYAISGDYVWSAFIHPLAELQPTQVVDALNQVATLAVTFGSSFSSGGLSFGNAEEDQRPE